MPAQYRFALDRDSRLVEIDELGLERRGEGAPFTCIGCGRVLIPKLGPIRVRHFSHRHTEVCSGETYRHGLAKRIFHDTYVRCLADKQPYTICIQRTRTCGHFAPDLGFTCDIPGIEEIDLTKYFDQVEMEREHGGFRADVLLRSSRGKDVLFVEFAVTHLSTAEKCASGFRILEIDIESEEQAAELGNRTINGSSNHVRRFNFKDPPPASLCRGACPRRVELFVVQRDGMCELTQAAVGDAVSGAAAPGVRRMEILSVAGKDIGHDAMLRRKAREAAFDGVHVRDCFLCRSHGLYMGVGGGPIFCRRLRKPCDSAAAVQCRHYWPMKSWAECEEADLRNDEWVQASEQAREKRRMEHAQKEASRRLSSSARQAENARRRFLEHEAEWKRTHPRPQPTETIGVTQRDTPPIEPVPEIPSQHDLGF